MREAGCGHNFPISFLSNQMADEFTTLCVTLQQLLLHNFGLSAPGAVAVPGGAVRLVVHDGRIELPANKSYAHSAELAFAHVAHADFGAPEAALALLAVTLDLADGVVQRVAVAVTDADAMRVLLAGDAPWRAKIAVLSGTEADSTTQLHDLGDALRAGFQPTAELGALAETARAWHEHDDYGDEDDDERAAEDDATYVAIFRDPPKFAALVAQAAQWACQRKGVKRPASAM